jgi:hypothetical protein
MTDLTSSALFSTPHVLATEEINTVFNAIIVHKANLESKRNIYNRSSLLPTLNTDFIRLAYYEINNKPNMTVHFLTSHSSFNIYLCKFDNDVYKVITQNDKNDHYVSKIFPLMSW